MSPHTKIFPVQERINLLSCFLRKVCVRFEKEIEKDLRNVELSMIGDTFFRNTCQGGDCKVFEERKVYNTTLKNAYDIMELRRKQNLAFALITLHNSEIVLQNLIGRTESLFLKSTLVECAHSAIRHKDSYFYAKYCKIAARRGGKRAIVAIAHSICLAIYHILLNKEHFYDLGSDYFNTIYAEKIKKRNIQSLEKLGFSVSLSYTNPYSKH